MSRLIYILIMAQFLLDLVILENQIFGQIISISSIWKDLVNFDFENSLFGKLFLNDPKFIKQTFYLEYIYFIIIQILILLHSQFLQYVARFIEKKFQLMKTK